jgi:TPR repeat protein
MFALSDSRILLAATALYCQALSGPAVAALDASSTVIDGSAPDAPRNDTLCNSSIECGRLGSSYVEGKSVRRDFERAARYFEAGCDLGDMKSCLGAAEIRRGGIGARKDEKQALRLFLRVCDAGIPRGCRFAGEIYEVGSRVPDVVPQDQAKAAGLYERACDGGEGVSCDSLANLYDTGHGVQKDRRRAKALRVKARKLGFDSRE